MNVCLCSSLPWQYVSTRTHFAGSESWEGFIPEDPARSGGQKSESCAEKKMDTTQRSNVGVKGLKINRDEKQKL